MEELAKGEQQIRESHSRAMKQAEEGEELASEDQAPATEETEVVPREDSISPLQNPAASPKSDRKSSQAGRSEIREMSSTRRRSRRDNVLPRQCFAPSSDDARSKHYRRRPEDPKA